MQRAASLEVTILDPDGESMQGRITLSQYRWDAEGLSLEPRAGTFSRDVSFRRGRYRFAGLPSGEFIVSVEPYTPFSVEDDLPITGPDDIARASGRSLSTVPLPSPPRWRYARIFHPGTS